MKKYLTKITKKSAELSKKYDDEINFIKILSAAIKTLVAFILIGKCGIVISIFRVYLNAEKHLKKSKFARLENNKIKHMRLANIYATILFTFGFMISLSQFI